MNEFIQAGNAYIRGQLAVITDPTIPGDEQQTEWIILDTTYRPFGECAARYRAGQRAVACQWFEIDSQTFRDTLTWADNLPASLAAA